ncbi:MAG: sulfatase [Planctomycetales bacterium]|nr:sulfatase [Planctomycetales bacterium]
MLLSCMVGSSQEPRNVLLICVDDLRPELNCFGKSYISSPHIDSLAAVGSRFSRHFVQAPTCGASRYALLTGQYGGASNEAIFERARRMASGDTVSPSMPAWFRQHGYTTVSVGKVSHHPGGRGGPDWNDDAILEMPDSWDRHLLPAGEWLHPRGAMHGLAHGEIRGDAKAMDVFQSTEGPDTIYPDGLIVDEALYQMKQFQSDALKPFFLAVGIIRPHLPFGAPAKYMEPYVDVTLPTIAHPDKPTGRSTWHASSEFMKYNRWQRNPNEDAEFATQVRKHYAACVSFADAQVGKLLDQLKQLGMWENTIVVLWGDHGWHLGEHAIWGKHALFEESLRSPLIIRIPNESHPNQELDAVVETLDIFPTLCQATGLPEPSFAQGGSLMPLIERQESSGHVAVSYTPKARTIRDSRYRLIAHDDGFLELYDHLSQPGETTNLAEQRSDICQDLLKQLDQRRGKNK